MERETRKIIPLDLLARETALVQDTIQDIADTVSDVKAEKQIKDPDPLESYGLNEASYTIIVTGENGDMYEAGL